MYHVFIDMQFNDSFLYGIYDRMLELNVAWSMRSTEEYFQ
jgi:hypothetical protein